MEEIILSIESLFANYGFKTGVVVMLSIFIVEIIKKPIVKKAEAYSLKSGLDKSIITKYLSFLPLGSVFVINLLWELVCIDFNFALLDFNSLLSTSLVMASITIATYEVLKKYLQAYCSKQNSKGQSVVCNDSNDNNQITNKKSEIRYL
ncbi:MAG: hypothetical protein IJZ29_02730 [Clostridia bacterium]|nr:hypothetical protein [Clostridia bacterium]